MISRVRVVSPQLPNLPANFTLVTPTRRFVRTDNFRKLRASGDGKPAGQGAAAETAAAAPVTVAGDVTYSTPLPPPPRRRAPASRFSNYTVFLFNDTMLLARRNARVTLMSRGKTQFVLRAVLDLRTVHAYEL